MSQTREIAADAGPFERFQVGDNVAHINMGDGTVTRNNGEYVVVTFACGVGEYDALWFQKYPRYLFHRGTAPLNT